MADATGMGRSDILAVEGLCKHFTVTKGFIKKRTVSNLRAVDQVSFRVARGETLGLVGESGCGKSTLGRCLVRAYAPTAGRIRFRFADGTETDFSGMNRKQLRPYRSYCQMIFQDPYGSLDPRMTVLDVIGEPLYIKKTDRDLMVQRVRELMQVVGLNPQYMNRYPHAFSGGQRQRIAIARALATSPEFIVADEPVSALDVSVQAQVINLLEDLQREFHLTILLVSHDLSVVEHVSNRVAVMYLGRLVELAPTRKVFSRPLHPYTEALLGSIPRISKDGRKHRVRLEGEVGSSLNLPPGCPFHPRCRYAAEICRKEAPEERILEDGSIVSCHKAGELSLQPYAV